MPNIDDDLDIGGLLDSETDSAKKSLSTELARLKDLNTEFQKGNLEPHFYNLARLRVMKRIKMLSKKIDRIEHTRITANKPERVYESVEPVSKKPFIIVFLLALGLVYAGIHAYLNSTCISVYFSSMAPELLSAVKLIRDSSPHDYAMVCANIDSLDYRHSSGLAGHARLNEYGEDRKVIISSKAMQHFNNIDSPVMTSAIIVHESFHYMMYNVMGGYRGMSFEEVEGAAERARFLFLYRAGYFSEYLEMVDALAMNAYGKQDELKEHLPPVVKQYAGNRQYSGFGDKKWYCDKAILGYQQVQGVEGKNIRFTNLGGVNIPCGFIDFRVNNLEYPVDCGVLQPGQTHESGENFVLKGSDSFTVRFNGCRYSAERL